MATTVYFTGEIASAQNLYDITEPLTGVIQFDKVASPADVVFDHGIISSGSQIALDELTGVITVDAGSDYQLTATVNTTRPLPASSAAGVQWYDLTNDVALSSVVPFYVPLFQLVCTTVPL